MKKTEKQFVKHQIPNNEKIRGVIIEVYVKNPEKGQHMCKGSGEYMIAKLENSKEIIISDKIDFYKFHIGDHIIVNQDLKQTLKNMELDAKLKSLPPKLKSQLSKASEIERTIFINELECCSDYSFHNAIDYLKETPKYKKAYDEFQKEYVKQDPKYQAKYVEPGERE